MPISENETRIRAVIKARADAIRTKNVQGVVVHFAENPVLFFLAAPLQPTSPLKEDMETWFATWRGPIGYDFEIWKSQRAMCRFFP